jgi:hypothetical protein
LTQREGKGVVQDERARELVVPALEASEHTEQHPQQSSVPGGVLIGDPKGAPFDDNFVCPMQPSTQGGPQRFGVERGFDAAGPVEANVQAIADPEAQAAFTTEAITDRRVHVAYRTRRRHPDEAYCRLVLPPVEDTAQLVSPVGLIEVEAYRACEHEG